MVTNVLVAIFNLFQPFGIVFISMKILGGDEIWFVITEVDLEWFRHVLPLILLMTA